MGLKEGSRVEVFRKKKEHYGSWFLAKILSKDGYTYTVRYEGEPVIDKVKEEEIRPCPPLARKKESWVLGDIAEVYDLHSWRIGKVAKVLNSDYVVVRLFGSIQLKKFHISNLRVRQGWQNNQWTILRKVSEEDIYNSFKHKTSPNFVAAAVKCEEACSRQKYDLDYICSFPHQINVSNKRKWTSETDEYKPPTKRSLPIEVDAFTFSNNLAGKNFVQNFAEDIIECSVASCSGDNYTVQNTRTNSRKISGNFFDDTMSSSSCTPKSDGLASNVHELELHAYKSTVLALYASGPLSWEQESLLTNLRMSLHISNEEHLLQLRNLLSARIL